MNNKFSRRGLLRLTILSGALALPSVLFLIFNWVFPLPPFAEEKRAVQVVTAEDGRPLRFFPDHRGVWRYSITFDRVSQDYLTMLLHYEDRWFFFHPGVNPLALLRAWKQNLDSSRIVSGGSTLTMQVARLIDPHERNYLGKLKQIFRALQLEWYYSKTEILNFYLNYAPFGGAVEGVETASYTYFNKSALRLSLAEAALLTVLPQLPSRLRPDRHPEAARSARNKVLERMGTLGIWGEREIEEALREPLAVENLRHDLRAAHLSEKLVSRYPHREVIRSTLDYHYQTEMEDLIQDYLSRFPEEISAAVVMIDHRDFQVKAYVGSGDYTSIPKQGFIDMVTAVRSPGSTLKPFLYALALEEGLIHSASLLSDVPQYFGEYQPLNFSRDFYGPVSVAAALQRSLNIPAVQILDAYGPQDFYSALENAGIDLRLLEGDRPNLSLILGGVGVTLYDLTAGFAAFGNLGTSARLRTIPEEPLEARRWLSPGAAWVINRILAEVPIHPSSRFFIRPDTESFAWKTGTSYGFRDSWVLASGSRYTLGLWMGRADGNYVTGNVSRTMALPLMRDILRLVETSAPPPKQPDTVSSDIICWPSGRLQTWEDPANCHVRKHAYLLRGMVPPTLPQPQRQNWAFREKVFSLTPAGNRLLADCVSSPTAQKKTVERTVVFWPKLLEPWIQEKWRAEALVPPLDPACRRKSRISEFNPSQLRIISLSPLDYSLRPVFGEKQILLNLKAVGAQGRAHWFLNHRWIQSASPDEEITIRLDQSGVFRISVSDDYGEYTERRIRVSI